MPGFPVGNQDVLWLCLLTFARSVSILMLQAAISEKAWVSSSPLVKDLFEFRYHEKELTELSMVISFSMKTGNRLISVECLEGARRT